MEGAHLRGFPRGGVRGRAYLQGRTEEGRGWGELSCVAMYKLYRTFSSEYSLEAEP